MNFISYCKLKQKVSRSYEMVTWGALVDLKWNDLAPIFTNRTIFSPKSSDDSNKFTKSLKKLLKLAVWGLETTFVSLGPNLTCSFEIF